MNLTGTSATQIWIAGYASNRTRYLKNETALSYPGVLFSVDLIFVHGRTYTNTGLCGRQRTANYQVRHCNTSISGSAGRWAKRATQITNVVIKSSSGRAPAGRSSPLDKCSRYCWLPWKPSGFNFEIVSLGMENRKATTCRAFAVNVLI